MLAPLCHTTNMDHGLIKSIADLSVYYPKEVPGWSGYSGVVLMDLSKTFDTLNHELMLAKLHVYGFDIPSLNLIHSYLNQRWHRTNINTSFSTWKKLLTEISQGSILGPLLFNVYINDLFFILEDTETCNYADDTCLYACDTDLKDLLTRLTHDSSLAIDWFDITT